MSGVCELFSGDGADLRAERALRHTRVESDVCESCAASQASQGHLLSDEHALRTPARRLKVCESSQASQGLSACCRAPRALRSTHDQTLTSGRPSCSVYTVEKVSSKFLDKWRVGCPARRLTTLVQPKTARGPTAGRIGTARSSPTVIRTASNETGPRSRSACGGKPGVERPRAGARGAGRRRERAPGVAVARVERRVRTSVGAHAPPPSGSLARR